MIHLITLNPAIDHFINVDEIKINKTNDVLDSNLVFGGKAINVAQILKQYDIDFKLVTTVDHDNEEFIKESLTGIDYELIPVKQIRINTKVNQKGNVTEFNSKGLALGENQEKFTHYIRKNVQPDDYVLIAGNPHPDDYDYMIKLCLEIKQITKNLIIDTSKITYDDLKRIKPKAIKPNDEEIEILLNQTITDELELITLGKEIINLGIQNIVITLGANGSIYISENECYKVEPIKDQVVNTVGAGDSFIAGMIYSYVKESSITELLKMATACASATTFNTGLATKAKIEKYYQMVQINQC